MITINFYKDGVYVKGHDTQEICSVISYGMYSCMNDCYLENADIYYYESANDKEWSRLGLTYLKINLSIDEHKKIYERFKYNISEWVKELYPSVNIVERMEENIDWNVALLDAKREQGLI